MGWFSSDKPKEVAKSAGKVVVKSLTWPVRKAGTSAQKKYLKAKGKLNSDVCPVCDNPISKKGGYVHAKCWRQFNQEVDSFSTPHREDGSSRSGNWFTNCNCNRNWAVHECKDKMGEPI